MHREKAVAALLLPPLLLTAAPSVQRLPGGRGREGRRWLEEEEEEGEREGGCEGSAACSRRSPVSQRQGEEERLSRRTKEGRGGEEEEKERERRRRGGGELNPQPHTHKAAAARARETAARARCGERRARQRRNFARSKPATWRCQTRAGSRNEHRGLPLSLPPLSPDEPRSKALPAGTCPVGAGGGRAPSPRALQLPAFPHHSASGQDAAHAPTERGTGIGKLFSPPHPRRGCPSRESTRARRRCGDSRREGQCSAPRTAPVRKRRRRLQVPW